MRPGLNYSAGGKGHGLWVLVEKDRAQAGWEWVFLSVERRRILILSPVGVRNLLYNSNAVCIQAITKQAIIHLQHLVEMPLRAGGYRDN